MLLSPLCLPAALVLALGMALGEAEIPKDLPVCGERGVGKRTAKRGGGFLGGTSVLGPGTQQPIAGVAYHLGGDTGAKFNVL